MTCEACKQPISMMCQKGTGRCCQICARVELPDSNRSKVEAVEVEIGGPGLAKAKEA